MRSAARLAAWALAFALVASPASAETPATDKPVCGRDLMTSEEQAAHREKMRGFATREERAAYRAEHHAKMLERAKQRGVELPPQGCPKGPGAGGAGGAGPQRP